MNQDLSEKYVALDEAIKLLGIDKGRFFYYVDATPIKKEPGNNKRSTLYNVEDIMKAKTKLEKRQNKTKKTETIVDWIGEKDVLTSLQLDYQVYGPSVFLANLAHYVERVKRNPHVALAVFNSPKREKIHAYISLLPLPEKTIIDVLSEKRHETDIQNNEVETYERKGEYTLLAESVVVDPDHKEALNTLLNHLTEYWCKQYPDRSISKIYAQAENEDGDILTQKLFFAPLENLAPNAFVLNMKRPGASRFIRNFQNCIKTRQKDTR